MKLGLIGAGRMGTFHAQTLSSHPEVSELRIADLNLAKAELLGNSVKASAVGDARALAGWADALVVASSTNTHVDMIRLGAEAGLPVFCEKPISLDLSTTDRVLEDVDRSGIALQIGFQRRFDPGFVEARRLVNSGELGTLYSARLATHDPAPASDEYIAVSVCLSIAQ